MLRQPGSSYRAGRDSTLLKVKSFDDDEAEVIAHEAGKGKHTGALGALRCRNRAGKVFNVGTGFSDAQRRDPPKVGEIITYRYQELTKDGIPRFPTFVGARADADPAGFQADRPEIAEAKVKHTGDRASSKMTVSAPGEARQTDSAVASSARVTIAGDVRTSGTVRNADLADVFEEMGAVHGIKGDRIRQQAYSKAADSLRRHPEAILSGDQAKMIPGIGAGMARRLDEVLETGELKELVALKEDPAVKAVRELRSVYGVGPKFAAELIQKHKIRSLAELRAAAAVGQVGLNAAQLVGLRVAEELQVKIPRTEVQEIEAALHRARDEMIASSEGPQDIIATICGSYRRGKTECGDVDVLLTSRCFKSDVGNPRAQQAKGGELLRRFVHTLRERGIITDDLAMGPTKYMGICKLDGPGRLHRRLDIRCFPYDQFYYGSLYFTGPRLLSIELRKRAIERGRVLNEYALVRKDDPSDHVLVQSEREIFEWLGAPYREPHER